MSKKVFYRYNPATDNYDRVYPSRWSRTWGFFHRLGAGIAIGAAVFVAVYLWVDFPREKLLKQENQQLRAQLDILNRRLDASLAVMGDVAARDDNFYRVMMGADRVPSAKRYAGIENERRYDYLNDLNDAQLLKNLTRKMDLLERQLYVQIKSFEELRNLALNNKDRIEHIPAIQPISELDMKQMASGYGYRSDPVYGMRKFHEGLDFAAAVGTPVYATAKGTIIKAERSGGYGNLIEIDHGYGYVTRYAHLSKMYVRKGQSVNRGDRIGDVGNTGKSTGSHLHYEVRLNGAPQNPVNYYFLDLTPEEYSEMIVHAENAGHVMD